MSLRPSPSSLAVALDRLIDRRRTEKVEAVDPKALRWLALLPEWTESLALDCEFPAGEEGIQVTIAEAQAAMLCDVVKRNDLTGGETVRFWMPDPMRSWLHQQWERQVDVRLESDVFEIASGILAAHGRQQPVSRGILRWAQLAEAELSQQVVTGETLSERVRESLGSGNLAEAGEWLFAGEWLSKPLGAVMEMAALRARRQISLHHLQIQDGEYLARFLTREGQLAELRKVAESEDEWGVHFVGLSGVGKTMLMRFISSQHEANPFRRSSRIDFDYLDPRIPLERPARLLQELGEGFAGDLETGAQESLFKSFLGALRAAESSREAMGPSAAGLAAGTRQFQQAIDSFALFLESLPQPVALVLDTCEELAKLHPPGGQMWSVNATFNILELLQEANRDLKLIVAGRRWLTAEYANEERRPPAPPEISGAPARKYLRFHETRGFTEGEVGHYLGQVRGLRLGEDLITTILETTYDPTRVPGVVNEDDDGEPRFSPNDVAFCATLLKESAELGRKAVEDGNFDSYVEERILKRLEDSPELVKVFPAAAILGRFDAATVEPVLGKTPVARRALLARLIAEDWTHLEGGPDPEEIVLKVDPGLLPRLISYYDGTPGRRRVREEAGRTLKKHLAEMLEQGPPGATVEVVDAAIRLLPPEQAVKKLERAAERVVEEGAWSWAEAVSQRLLDPERTPELDASLLATAWTLYLVGMKHSHVTMDLAELWDGVAKMASDHPDEKRGALLLTRSRLNSLAAATASDDFEFGSAAKLLDEGRRSLGKPGGDSVVSALMAASEALIDAREQHGRAIPVTEIKRVLLRLSRQFKETTSMRLHLAALRGRLSVLAGEPRSALNAFTEVALLVRKPDEELPRFADWEGPGSPAARAMLELLRFRLAAGEIGEGLLSRGEDLAYRTGTDADSAQLLSLVVQARMAKGSLTASQLERAGAYEARLESYHLTVPAHRTAPSLFVSVARGWVALGRIQRGLGLLRERERMATSRRTDERSTSAAAFALLGLLRRLRLREGLSLADHLIGVDEEQRAEALAAGALIAGLQPTLHPDAEDDHAAWRVRNLLEPSTNYPLLERGEGEDLGEDLGDYRQSTPQVHRLLDLLESELVRQRWDADRTESETAGLLRELLAPLAMGDAPPPTLADPLGLEQMRIRLRAWALLDVPYQPLIDSLRGQLGQVALEEGELLALRLPDRAEALLELAAKCFAEIGDDFGAFTAQLRLAIAEIHAGKLDDALHRREGVLEPYERLRARDGLPALGALMDRDTGELIESGNPLRGWVWRLAFYLRWCEGRSIGARATATAMEFGPEFDLRSAAGFDRGSRIMGRGLRRQRFASQSPTLYRWWPAFPALVGLLVLGVSTTVAIAVAVLVAIPLTLVAIEVIGPHLPRRILPLSGFDLTLASFSRLEQGPALQAYGFVAVYPRAKLFLLRLYLYALKHWRLVDYTMVPTGGDISEGASLPENIDQALRRQLLGGWPPLRLEVGSDLSWVPWEGILLSKLTAKDRWRPDRSPQVVRIRPRGFPSPSPRWGSRISAVCTPRWRQFLETSSGGSARWLPDLGEAQASRGTISLGTAVETKAGWRLRLDEDRLIEPLRDPSEPLQQQLVSPDTLARNFPIVVLMPPPGGEPLTTDRQASEGLRSLGSEVFLAGACAVITLPVLPLGVAARVIEILVEKLEGWGEPPDEAALRQCAELIRSAVFAGTHRDQFETEAERLWRVELALDVCVFTPRPKKGR